MDSLEERKGIGAGGGGLPVKAGMLSFLRGLCGGTSCYTSLTKTCEGLILTFA